jgi:hypothetical protein
MRGWLLPFVEPSTASLTLPDGTFLSAPITSGATPELAQLPRGIYDLRIAGLVARADVPVAIGTTNSVSITVFSLFDALVLVGIAVGIGTAIARTGRREPASPALQKPI